MSKTYYLRPIDFQCYELISIWWKN